VWLPAAESALIAACILLLTGRIHPGKIMSRVDRNLLVFFSALFIISGAIEAGGIASGMSASVSNLLSGSSICLSAITVVPGNLISNVPAHVIAQAYRGPTDEPHGRMAYTGSNLHSGREFNFARAGRKPDRCRGRRLAQHQAWVLGVHPLWFHHYDDLPGPGCCMDSDLHLEVDLEKVSLAFTLPLH
jgi:hypothetical protein